jgi:cytochrome P450
MLFSNPPVHTRLRRLVSRAFTPNAVARLGPKISETTLSLIEQFTHGEEIDFIEQIASPLTVTVIAEMLGIPPGDRVDFARWSDASALTIAPVLPAGAREKAFELSVEFARYLRIAVEERHSVPRDDMISALINVELDGERLTDDDIVQMATLLIAAGNETTRTLMANALAVLLAHPHQFQILKDEPTLTPRMVEEVLRFEPSVYYTFRIATQEVQFGATTIPPDSVVLVSIASANRDDREFALPDSLDIARSPNRHVSFASGIHSCLGAPLARLESQLALPLIFGRFTNLTAGSYPPERRIDALTRGLATLPISL